MNADDDRVNRETAERFRRAVQQPPIEWSEPSPGIWQAIAAGTTEATPAEPVSNLETHPGTRTRRLVLTTAAGFVIGGVLGAGGANWWAASSRSSGTLLGAADLTPLKEPGRVLGRAELRRDRAGYKLLIEIANGLSNDHGYVEVWLINLDLTRMVSVGVFAGGDSASFRIDESFIEAGYVIVDLSREAFDEDATHSGDTVMRGKLVL